MSCAGALLHRPPAGRQGRRCGGWRCARFSMTTSRLPRRASERKREHTSNPPQTSGSIAVRSRLLGKIAAATSALRDRAGLGWRHAALPCGPGYRWDRTLSAIRSACAGTATTPTSSRAARLAPRGYCGAKLLSNENAPCYPAERDLPRWGQARPPTSRPTPRPTVSRRPTTKAELIAMVTQRKAAVLANRPARPGTLLAVSQPNDPDKYRSTWPAA